jgi:GGDEF domain-containing protein
MESLRKAARSWESKIAELIKDINITPQLIYDIQSTNTNWAKAINDAIANDNTQQIKSIAAHYEFINTFFRDAGLIKNVANPWNTNGDLDLIPTPIAMKRSVSVLKRIVEEENPNTLIHILDLTNLQNMNNVQKSGAIFGDVALHWFAKALQSTRIILINKYPEARIEIGRFRGDEFLITISTNESQKNDLESISTEAKLILNNELAKYDNQILSAKSAEANITNSNLTCSWKEPICPPEDNTLRQLWYLEMSAGNRVASKEELINIEERLGGELPNFINTNTQRLIKKQELIDNILNANGLVLKTNIKDFCTSNPLLLPLFLALTTTTTDSNIQLLKAMIVDIIQYSYNPLFDALIVDRALLQFIRSVDFETEGEPNFEICIIDFLIKPINDAVSHWEGDNAIQEVLKYVITKAFYKDQNIDKDKTANEILPESIRNIVSFGMIGPAPCIIVSNAAIAKMSNEQLKDYNLLRSTIAEIIQMPYTISTINKSTGEATQTNLTMPLGGYVTSDPSIHALLTNTSAKISENVVRMLNDLTAADFENFIDAMYIKPTKLNTTYSLLAWNRFNNRKIKWEDSLIAAVDSSTELSEHRKVSILNILKPS